MNKEEVLGQVVMIRTYSAGVHYGELVGIESAANGYDVILKNCRRVYNWAGACSLSQLAIEGSKSISECKISITIPMILLRAIEIIPMSDEAVDNLKESIWKS